VNSNWSSRKVWLVVPLVVAGVGLTVWMMAVGRYEFALGAFGITAGIVGVYNGANVWQSRAYSDHGQPPGLES